MRSGASYSVRGGSLRVRKVVTTNSQGKKKKVKSFANFNLIALWYFKNCLTLCNFKSGYMKVGIPLEVRDVLPDESLNSVPVEVGGGVTDTRKVDTSCVYNQAG